MNNFAVFSRMISARMYLKIPTGVPLCFLKKISSSLKKILEKFLKNLFFHVFLQEFLKEFLQEY